MSNYTDDVSVSIEQRPPREPVVPERTTRARVWCWHERYEARSGIAYCRDCSTVWLYLVVPTPDPSPRYVQLYEDSYLACVRCNMAYPIMHTGEYARCSVTGCNGPLTVRHDHAVCTDTEPDTGVRCHLDREHEHEHEHRTRHHVMRWAA